jgi:hypothetical protein
MRTSFLIILTSIIIIIAGCGGNYSPQIIIDEIHPYGGKSSYGETLRLFIRGPDDHNISSFVNEIPISPEVVYWDEYYTEHWVFVFIAGENFVIGNNTISAFYNQQKSNDMIWKIVGMTLPIETNYLFVGWVNPVNYHANERLVHFGDEITISMHGLPEPSDGKDIRIQVISIPSGEKRDISIKNGLLVRLWLMWMVTKWIIL